MSEIYYWILDEGISNLGFLVIFLVEVSPCGCNNRITTLLLLLYLTTHLIFKLTFNCWLLLVPDDHNLFMVLCVQSGVLVYPNLIFKFTFK